VIAKRSYGIALQSIITGMGLSGVAMGIAAVGFLPPVAGALTPELIDVVVILNALRALRPAGKSTRKKLTPKAGTALRLEHESLETALDRLREIADALDSCGADHAAELITDADRIVEREVVAHERNDESAVYPQVANFLADRHGLGAMSRAHREIIHLARLLRRLSAGLSPADVDRYLIRDAQRLIESIEALVRIHNAQEEDIYEHAIGA
jgi:hypothetical protein